MKKELFIHFVTYIVLFLVLTLLHWQFTPIYLLFWLGGLVGTFLPDIDHFIYAYFLRPHELTSQRAKALMSRGEVMKTLDLLATTRAERSHLIFHSLLFQVFFLLLTYWVLTSAGSMFGRGLVLAFSLHLVIDQFVDLAKLDNLNNWLHGMKINLTKERATIYCIAVLVGIFILGIAF